MRQTYLNFSVGLKDFEPVDYQDNDDVAVLYCNDQEIWCSSGRDYIDYWGDGGQDAADIVINKLRELLNDIKE